MKYGNLHLHSTFSDGGFRPTHLVALAKSLGYSAISITDHENINGLDEMFAAAKINQIEAMSGVELNGSLLCEDGKEKYFHIVGLDFDPGHPSIIDITNIMTEMRNKHTRLLYESAAERGLLPKVAWEEIMRCNPNSKWFCNDQVYYALDALGLFPFYKKQESFPEAFKGNNKIAPFQMLYQPASIIINAIRDAGGIAILAHPASVDIKCIPELVKLGLQGIETCHPDMDEEATRLAIHAAVEFNLYTSGGTDHTGPMSACGGRLAIPAYQGVTFNEFTSIKERCLNN